MRKFFVFVLLCCFASSARAEFDCSKRPTCEGMGYVIESFAKCYNQVTLRCPFDATYVYCGEDTINLNCYSGMPFDVVNNICYQDDTTSDYIFIRYNNERTEAYLLDTTKYNNDESAVNYDTGDQEYDYQNALKDMSPKLLSRDMLEELLASGGSSSIQDLCYRVRNGASNQIVRVANGAIAETVADASAFFSGSCNHHAHAHYYARARLYQKE